MATPTIDFRAGKLRILMMRGDTAGVAVGLRVNGVDEDLTGRTYRAQIRRTENSATAYEVTVDTAEAADGVLILRMDPEVTGGLSGDFVWDLEEDNGGTIRTRGRGPWIFTPDTTRAIPE
jgi:hypothetical protein